MPLKEIRTDNAPAAVGPYSQAVEAGGFVFVSGQIPLAPSTGKLVEGGIREQTERVLDNLAAVLDARGIGPEHIVRCDVFLKDMDDFKSMNEVYESKFTGDIKPARQAVEIARLPLDAQVEISCIARVAKGAPAFVDYH